MKGHDRDWAAEGFDPEDTMTTPRKIDLPDFYCPHAYTSGGDKDCDHDYDPKPVSKSDYGATWKCTKCGMKTTFDVWD